MYNISYFFFSVLPCFYVYPQNESLPSQGSQAASALESIDQIEVSSREEVWEGEEYEHDRALSADRTFLKFKKRLDCVPEQCFRYYPRMSGVTK